MKNEPKKAILDDFLSKYEMVPYWAVPWSFVEVYVAAFICRKIIVSSSTTTPPTG